jgi:hypothetical protein
MNNISQGVLWKLCKTKQRIIVRERWQCWKFFLALEKLDCGWLLVVGDIVAHHESIRKRKCGFSEEQWVLLVAKMTMLWSKRRAFH